MIVVSVLDSIPATAFPTDWGGSVNGIVIRDVQQYADVNGYDIVVALSTSPVDQWIPVPVALNRRIATGWRYIDEQFAPPNLSAYLADCRASALKLIAAKHAEMLTVATGGATSAERDTWAVKEAAALDVLAGGDGYGVIVPVAGETKQQLASKVAAKAVAFRQLVGIADNIKRTAEKAVEALTLETVDDLSALNMLIETAKQQALAALQQATGE